MVKPLLRRGGVMPPEAFDNSYGGLIKRKQKKYRTAGKAFGVEGFTMDTAKWIPIIVIVVIFVIALFFSMKTTAKS
jgi:hypothetical protein